jgi:dinuclear metal center YbgI/SA1388 family protein
VPAVANIVSVLETAYPPHLAEEWDAVGPVCGSLSAEVRRLLLVVDVTDETVAEAVEWGAQLIVAHHPLLLRGVHSVATSTPKGRMLDRLIREGIAVVTAHTNADSAEQGVSDALAARLGVGECVPLMPKPGQPSVGLGRVGLLREPMTLAAFATAAASALPATTCGVRVAGDPAAVIRRVAVCGGAGDSLLTAARDADADVYVTSDLRHHPVSEHLAAGGPALIDAAHWATERPWLDQAAALLGEVFPGQLEVRASDLVTDAWALLEVATPRGERGEAPAPEKPEENA